MTTIICVPPQTTILAMSWIPLLMLVGYAVMVKSDQKPVQGVTTHTDVTYTSLLQESTPDEGNPLSWKEKRELIVQNIHLVLAFAVGYFSEFVTLNAVVTTIAFPNSLFDPRSHYVYYACVFMIGEFIGRSYLTFLSLVKCSYTPVLTRTWILSAILFSLLVFLTLSSWYRFVHSVWIVLALCFLVGVLAGSLYLNTFLVATAGGSDDINGKAFSRAFLSVGPSAGVLLAGVVGLALEPALRRHCLEHAKYGEFCFTRSMTGWNKTTSCLR